MSDLTQLKTKDMFKSITAYMEQAIPLVEKMPDEIQNRAKIYFFIGQRGLAIDVTATSKGSSLGVIKEYNLPWNEFKENPTRHLNLFYTEIVNVLNGGNSTVDSCSIHFGDLIRSANIVARQHENLSSYGQSFDLLKKTIDNKNINWNRIDVSGEIDWFHIQNNYEKTKTLGYTGKIGNENGIFFDDFISEETKQKFFSEAIEVYLKLNKKRGKRFDKKISEDFKMLYDLRGAISQEFLEEIIASNLIKSNDVKNSQTMEFAKQLIDGENYKNPAIIEVNERIKQKANSTSDDFFKQVTIPNCLFLSPSEFNFSKISYYENDNGNIKAKFLDKSDCSTFLMMTIKLLSKSIAKKDLQIDGCGEFKVPGGEKLVVLKVKDGFDLEALKDYADIILKNIKHITEATPIGSFASYASSKNALDSINVFVGKELLNRNMQKNIDMKESEDFESSSSSFKL